MLTSIGRRLCRVDSHHAGYYAMHPDVAPRCPRIPGDSLRSQFLGFLDLRSGWD